MKLKSARIKNFKRFTDLTVQDLPETNRLVILAGPHGCGKSSFFDALGAWYSNTCLRKSNWDNQYHPKFPDNQHQNWNSDIVKLEFHEDFPQEDIQKIKLMYLRSAYRHEENFRLHSIEGTAPQMRDRVGKMNYSDRAVSRNYKKIVDKALKDVFGDLPDDVRLGEFRENTVKPVRDSILRLIPDLNLSQIDDPRLPGTFEFTKTDGKKFLYENLSGGERSAFDLILDLTLMNEYYDNTIYCIDEPEVHMNPRLHADLLSEILNLIPDNCQLMLATHAIGMMRKASDIEKSNPGTVSFLDFGDHDFDQAQVIGPTRPTRMFWRKVHAVALHDLATLISPSRVVVCEGSPKVPKSTRNQSHDARCYDPIFEEEFPETRFISGGNSNDVATDRFVLTEALGDLIRGLDVVQVIDRDDRSTNEISDLARRGVRVLSRRNLESYLFDDEVLKALATSVGKVDKLEELLARKIKLVECSSGAPDDLKPIRGLLYNACKDLLELNACGSTAETFMRDTLAPLVQPEMTTYKELRADIFGIRNSA